MTWIRINFFPVRIRIRIKIKWILSTVKKFLRKKGSSIFEKQNKFKRREIKHGAGGQAHLSLEVFFTVSISFLFSKRIVLSFISPEVSHDFI